MLIRMGYTVRALAVTVPILYQWQTEVRTTTSVWKPHPITAGLGGVVHNSPKNHTADQFKAYQISNNGMSLLHIREENLPVLLARKGMTVLEVSSDYSDQAMQEKCAAILSQVNYPT